MMKAEIERLRNALERIANHPAPSQAATGDAMKGYMEALNDVGAIAEQALRATSRVCEKCWADAQLRAAIEGGPVIDRYHEILEERADHPCSEELSESHTGKE